MLMEFEVFPSAKTNSLLPNAPYLLNVYSILSNTVQNVILPAKHLPSVHTDTTDLANGKFWVISQKYSTDCIFLSKLTCYMVSCFIEHQFVSSFHLLLTKTMKRRSDLCRLLLLLLKVLRISLGLTLSWYRIPGEECKSYPSNPNPVTANLLALTTPTLLQGHMIFSMHQTSFVAEVWRLTVRLRHYAVSGVGAHHVLRIRTQDKSVFWSWRRSCCFWNHCQASPPPRLFWLCPWVLSNWQLHTNWPSTAKWMKVS